MVDSESAIPALISAQEYGWIKYRIARGAYLRGPTTYAKYRQLVAEAHARLCRSDYDSIYGKGE